MTFDEMERSLQKIRDVQLVNARLLDRIEQNMDRHEQEWNERFVHLEAKVVSHEDGIAEMRAAMAGLFERMDRFIQGLERGNGHV